MIVAVEAHSGKAKPGRRKAGLKGYSKIGWRYLMNKNFKKLIMHLMEWVAKHFPDGWRKVATMARYALTLQTPPLQPMMSEFAVPIVEFPREDVEKLIEWLAQYDLISFDVFDTLVLRAFDDPKMIFHLWGLKNCQQYTYNVRSAISLDLRAKTGREIKLTEIYQELERHFGVTAEKGMEQEIQLELRYCMPNPYMKQVYDSLIQMGKRIIIVSDMYLPKEAITRILDKCGYKGYEALYVSCDCGCTKRSGTMWTYLNSLYGDIRRVHVGDSPNGDANQAKRWGWKTKLYTNLHSINGKPWEKEMSHLIGSLYRGTIDRYLYTGSPRKNPLYDLGFVYFGLPIYGFCQWLHELAVGKKIDLILFAARDMYTVHQVYREHYDTPCEYLPISRTSIWRADFDGGVESILEHMKLVVNREKPYSIREFCELQHISFLLPYLKQTLFFITQETLPEIEQAILKHKDEITALLRTDQQGASSYYRNLCEKYNNPKHILFPDFVNAYPKIHQ